MAHSRKYHPPHASFTFSDPDRIQIAIQLIPGGILVAFGFLLIESPRWLRSKGRIAEADKNISILRNLPTGKSPTKSSIQRCVLMFGFRTSIRDGGKCNDRRTAGY